MSGEPKDFLFSVLHNSFECIKKHRLVDNLTNKRSICGKLKLSSCGRYLKLRMCYEPDRDHHQKQKDEFHIRHFATKRILFFPSHGFLQTKLRV